MTKCEKCDNEAVLIKERFVGYSFHGELRTEVDRSACIDHVYQVAGEDGLSEEQINTLMTEKDSPPPA